MYYKLLETLAPMDRCHNSLEMHSAYGLLVEYYKGSRLLTYDQGSDVNHWTIPPYWTCNYATLKDDKGAVIASYKKNKLSLFTYSPSVNRIISLKELQKHLFSNSNRPDSVCFHFRNQYRHWEPLWGFSIPDRIRKKLKDVQYQVDIDSNMDYSKPMVQSDYHHKGASDETYLFVGHFDHPKQVNDGLSGCIAAYEIIKRIQGKNTRFSYRAFSSVEIVGSSHYLENKHSDAKNLKEAVFLAFSGIESSLAYQKSYNGDSFIDRVVVFLLKFYSKKKSESVFLHRELVGNDENMFDSVGYEIPCGTLMRQPFPEYHTDSDDMSITSKDKIEEVIVFCLQIIDIIENNAYYSSNIQGVPCLSHPEIDLYLSPDVISGTNRNSKHDFERFSFEMPNHERVYLQENTNLLNQLMQNILRLSDGNSTIFDVAEVSNIPFSFVFKYALLLQEKGIITLHEGKR
jgi:aminopeptidase-like protein